MPSAPRLDCGLRAYSGFDPLYIPLGGELHIARFAQCARDRRCLLDPDFAEFAGAARLCCTNRVTGRPFLSRTELSCDLCEGRAEGGKAVEDGDSDLELCNLTVEVARGQALPEELDAVHLGFSAASAVITAPSSPDRSTEAF